MATDGPDKKLAQVFLLLPLLSVYSYRRPYFLGSLLKNFFIFPTL
jgi:hypothetical protein